jgi:transcriptional regulator with XRE-family HTH domain
MNKRVVTSYAAAAMKRRKELGMTAREVSERAGVSLPTIGSLEQGRDVTLASAVQIFQGLGLRLVLIEEEEQTQEELQNVG